MMKEVWIVIGRVQQWQIDDGTYPNATVGQPEYQFSDGPPGERGSSADYLNLQDGLSDHSGYVVYWTPEGSETPPPFMPTDVKFALLDGLLADRNAFDETDSDFDDYSAEDREVFTTKQKAAYDWLGETMPE